MFNEHSNKVSEIMLRVNVLNLSNDGMISKECFKVWKHAYIDESLLCFNAMFGYEKPRLLEAFLMIL